MGTCRQPFERSIFKIKLYKFVQVKDPHLCDGHDLLDDVKSPEAREAVIPDGGQQLLNTWVGHKLLLVRVDGQLEPGERLDFACMEDKCEF